MKRFAFAVAALAVLVTAGAAVAHLKAGNATAVSATLSAPTAANVQTRTLTCAGQTIEVTTGRYTGTSTSTTPDLNGPVELHVKSVYNTTTKLGWVDGHLKIRGADNRTNAGFSAVNVDGKLDGWVRGSAGHRDGILFGSLSGTFTKAGGLTAGAIGSGAGANAAVIAKNASCSTSSTSRPSVHLLVRGAVESVSATSIAVKPRDGSATQTCAVKDDDDVERVKVGDQVEMTCVQVSGAWTLAKVRKR